MIEKKISTTPKKEEDEGLHLTNASRNGRIGIKREKNKLTKKVHF